VSLIRTSALSALQTGIKILAGFAIVKVVALAAGPEGMAQLGQFQNLLTLLVMLAGGMLGTGLTRLLAEHQSVESRLAISHASLRLTLQLSLGLTVLVLLGAPYLARYVLHDASLLPLVVLLPVFVLTGALSVLWLALLNGCDRIVEMTRISIASSLLMLLVTVPLAWLWQKPGAFLSVALPSLLLVVYIAWQQQGAFRRVLAAPVQPAHRRLLWRFALMALASAVAAPVAQMVVRDYLAQRLSLHEAGIWQGVTRISEVYLVFLTSSLSVYFLPRLARTTDQPALLALLLQVLRFVMPVALVLGVTIYVLRDLLIWLLFSDAFTEMRDLFAWQLVGDLVKIAAWVFAYVVLARGRVVWFVTGEVVFHTSYALLVIALVPALGLRGAMLAYGLNYLMYLAYVAFLARRIYLVMDKPNV